MVRARFNPQETVHMQLLRPWQAASRHPQRNKQGIITSSNHFLQVGDPNGSVSVATLLPGDTSGADWVDVLEMAEMGRGCTGKAPGAQYTNTIYLEALSFSSLLTAALNIIFWHLHPAGVIFKGLWI